MCQNKVAASEFHHKIWSQKTRIVAGWLTDWLYLHNQTLQINSEIENYNVQDKKKWTHWQLQISGRKSLMICLVILT